MAEKRMISRVISISKKFNTKLDDHFSRLLYLMLIPHSDDFGRISGDPYDIKALILPMMADATPQLIEQSLAKLHNAKLITWYSHDGDKYIQIINFDEHQTGLHKRTKSKFPEPPEHSGNFPENPPERTKERTNERIEQNETEEKGKEGRKEGHLALPENIQDKKESLRVLCNQMNIHGFTLHHLDIVFSYIGAADIEVIEAAIKKSQNKPHSYLTNTLEGMIVTDKITRVEQLFPNRGEKDAEHERRNEGVRSGSTPAKSPEDSITGGKVGWIGNSKYKSNIIPLQDMQG